MNYTRQTHIQKVTDSSEVAHRTQKCRINCCVHPHTFPRWADSWTTSFLLQTVVLLILTRQTLVAHPNSLRPHSICMCMYTHVYTYVFTTQISKTKGSATLVGGKKMIISYRCETKFSIKQLAWNSPSNCNFCLLVWP